MAFGPEASNPREKRAYAHTMIGKFAEGEADYFTALRAAYIGSLTQAGARSGFDSALSSAINKMRVREQQRFDKIKPSNIDYAEHGMTPDGRLAIIAFFGHRRIRHIPLNWEHPKDESGKHLPLHDIRESGAYSLEEVQELLNEGYISSVEELKDDYMPDFSQVPVDEMAICLYETTTEGTPQTPVYPDTPEGRADLTTYASEYVDVFAGHMASTQEWQEKIFSSPT